MGSSAGIRRGLSCVCAQRRDVRLSFDLTPTQGQIKMIVMQGVPAVWINFLASLNKVEGISIQNLG